jgi:phage-related protein
MSQIGDNEPVPLEVFFLPSTRKVVKGFPREVQWELGGLLWEIQRGHRFTMPLSRPMRTIGDGVEELRLKDSSGIYRFFYVVRSAKGVLVFHAFKKKSQKTPTNEILAARKRLRMLEEMLDAEED